MKYVLKSIVVLCGFIIFIGWSRVENSETNAEYVLVNGGNNGLSYEADDLYEVEEYIAKPESVMEFMSSAVGGNFPVFSSQYAEEWEKILSPQLVELLNVYDNWLEISIDDEIWWVDIDFIPSLDEITEVFSSLGEDVSFYFHNIETGFQYGFNSEREYIGASVGKVFFAYFLYKQDEIGNITLTNQERLWIQAVLRTSLDEFSHNLHACYGIEDYNVWLEEQGVCILQTYRHFGLPTRLTVGEAASLMYGIYHYFQTNTPNAIEFRENMINNQARFIVSNSYEVASKTGWLFDRNIIHDVAIVESSSPYILVILSQSQQIGGNHLHYFESLSHLFEDFNDKWFVVE